MTNVVSLSSMWIGSLAPSRASRAASRSAGSSSQARARRAGRAGAARSRSVARGASPVPAPPRSATEHVVAAAADPLDPAHAACRARQQAGQVAGAIADHRHPLLGERREHKLGGRVAPSANDPSQATGRVKRRDNQLHRARVLEVRIQSPQRGVRCEPQLARPNLP